MSSSTETGLQLEHEPPNELFPKLYKVNTHSLDPTPSFEKTILVYRQDLKPAKMREVAEYECEQNVPLGRHRDMGHLGLYELQPPVVLYSRSADAKTDKDDVLVAYCVNAEDVASGDEIDAIDRAMADMRGPPELMSTDRPDEDTGTGGTLLERLHMVPVENGRCFSLATSYQVTKSLFGPVTDVKVMEGVEGQKAKIIRDLLKSAAPVVMKAFRAVAPVDYMALLEQNAEAKNLPRVGCHSNIAFPAVQLNLASAIGSDEVHSATLGTQMSPRFGDGHSDVNDDPAGLTAYLTSGNIPPSYEAGRFHLLGLGIYAQTLPNRILGFSGIRRHGASPPIAPPGEQVDPTVLRSPLVFYPKAKVVNGAENPVIAFASLPEKPPTKKHLAKAKAPSSAPKTILEPVDDIEQGPSSRLFTLGKEITNPTLRSHQRIATPAQLLSDGAAIMEPADHASTSVRHMASLIEFFLEQMPSTSRPVLDRRRLLSSFSLQENGKFVPLHPLSEPSSPSGSENSDAPSRPADKPNGTEFSTQPLKSPPALGINGSQNGTSDQEATRLRVIPWVDLTPTDYHTHLQNYARRTQLHAKHMPMVYVKPALNRYLLDPGSTSVTSSGVTRPSKNVAPRSAKKPKEKSRHVDTEDDSEDEDADSDLGEETGGKRKRPHVDPRPPKRPMMDNGAGPSDRRITRSAAAQTLAIDGDTPASTVGQQVLPPPARSSSSKTPGSKKPAKASHSHGLALFSEIVNSPICSLIQDMQQPNVAAPELISQVFDSMQQVAISDKLAKSTALNLLTVSASTKSLTCSSTSDLANHVAKFGLIMHWHAMFENWVSQVLLGVSAGIKLDSVTPETPWNQRLAWDIWAFIRGKEQPTLVVRALDYIDGPTTSHATIKQGRPYLEESRRTALVEDRVYDILSKWFDVSRRHRGHQITLKAVSSSPYSFALFCLPPLVRLFQSNSPRFTEDDGRYLAGRLQDIPENASESFKTNLANLDWAVRRRIGDYAPQRLALLLRGQTSRSRQFTVSCSPFSTQCTQQAWSTIYSDPDRLKTRIGLFNAIIFRSILHGSIYASTKLSWLGDLNSWHELCARQNPGHLSTTESADELSSKGERVHKGVEIRGDEWIDMTSSLVPFNDAYRYFGKFQDVSPSVAYQLSVDMALAGIASRPTLDEISTIIHDTQADALSSLVSLFMVRPSGATVVDVCGALKEIDSTFQEVFTSNEREGMDYSWIMIEALLSKYHSARNIST